MNIFKVFTGNYEGNDEAGNQADGVNSTILTLRSRLTSSSMLADRRDAVRGLKSLAKSYRKEVADQCLDSLIDCLCNDRNDNELIGLCLEALNSIFNDNEDSNMIRLGDNSHQKNGETPSEDVLAAYADKLAKEEIFSVILTCLEEHDFPIRFPSIRLLISLLQLRSREMQQLVLLNPTAVARFMDLLSDIREVIRNDALILLIHLTRGNSSIQKIVVFENVFEKLFSIMAMEGHADGGVVTQDCLELLLSLLTGNSANQLLFKEGSFVQHLVPFFDSLPSSPLSVQKTWTPEKTTNFILLFQLIRHLVTPGSGQQQIATVQKIAHQCGLLKKISEMLNEAGLPNGVLIESLAAVGELCRDLPAAQDAVIHLSVTSMRPPRPLIVVLLMTLINDKQPVNTRIALLYCIQCLLHKNKSAQLNIIKGMCPESIEQAVSNPGDSQLAFSTSAGQLIVSGLLALDSPSAWLTAGVLLAALGGNNSDSDELRQALLGAQLTMSLGAQPVTLLEQTTSTLAMQKLRLSTRAGLLQLLCIWLAYCPSVVDALLADAPAVACLLSQVSQPPSDDDEAVVRSLSAFAIGLCILFNRQTDKKLEYNRDKLVMVVRRRIGIETFGDALALIASNEGYARCLRSPRPISLSLSHRDDSDLVMNMLPLFTHEFCIIYRQLEHEVLSSLSVTHQQQTMTTIGQIQSDSNNRNSPFDVQNAHLNDRLAMLETNLADRNAECEQLRRELGSYKMALADGANEYRSVLAEKDRTIGTLQAELMAARSFAQMRGDEKNSSECGGHMAEIERLKCDLSSLRQEQEDLLLLLSHQDARIARLREKLRDVGQQDSEDEEDDEEDEGLKSSEHSENANNSKDVAPVSGNKKPEVALGESAFGLSPPTQQDINAPQSSTEIAKRVEQPTLTSYYDPTQFVQKQFYPDPQQQQQQSQNYPLPPPQQGYPYVTAGYPYASGYPYSNQQQTQQYGNYGNQVPNTAANSQTATNGSSLASYFNSPVTVSSNGNFYASQTAPVQEHDGDGSESAATSDSQNSQIRVQ